MNPERTGSALHQAIVDNPGEETPVKMFADFLREQGNEDRATAVAGVVKRYGTDFASRWTALTLSPSQINQDGHDAKPWVEHTRTHADGWTITGTLSHDYVGWVNEFYATHPHHGVVWGDFESLVFASSEEAYQDFYSKHAPEEWCYEDI
jgi:uncharacterized protein (TIGR02996 family)